MTTGGPDYGEISFTAAAGTLAPGQSSGEIQVRFNKTDWSTYDQSNDYSFDSAADTFMDFDKSVLLCQGYQIWGITPGGKTPGPTPPATPAPLPTPTPDFTNNLALRKPASSSSVQKEFFPEYAVDGDKNTRWSSDFSDPQWLMVDLGRRTNIVRVSILREAAFARACSLQVSDDRNLRTDIASENNGDGNADTLACEGAGRYFRIYCTQRL